MSKYILISSLFLGFASVSCERCMTCSYSYDETIIIQTVNGEEEQVNTYTGRFILDDDGRPWSQECIKTNTGEDFTIENTYENEKQTTDLENFQYQCQEQ